MIKICKIPVFQEPIKSCGQHFVYSDSLPSMAISPSNSHFFNHTEHKKPSTSIIIIFAFLIIIKSAFPQSSDTSCILNIRLSSPENNSNCTSRNWGGFLSNNCCGSTFDGYLEALGKRANQTGQIFLNSTEQNDCLASIKSINGYVFSCGIDKLTSGAGGCSDYSVKDVVDKLGNSLKSLSEDCKVLALNGESDKSCSSCLRRWESIGNVETNVCRFAVLVSFISEGIYDDKGREAVYKCLGEKSLPIDDHGVKKRQKIQFSTGMWVLIGGLVGIGLIIIVATWMILSRKPVKSQLPKAEDESNDSLSEESSCHKIAIKQVYSATDNLSASNFIGQGIAGKVYKGILSNGQHIAVKHIINDSEMETFVREVTSLSHVRHPNLVTLLGHCKAEDECFLVYELCHKGNLAEWIFGKDKYLSWIQRLEIAIDCARGLWFLHTYPEGCIVHRDIKPTNILICDNFQGKLSDFGLSKVIDMGQSYVSSEVRGTFGYVDPEYQKNRRVNSSGDVYSFGIVLLQLLSGQRVINLDLTKPMALDKRAKILTKGGNMTEFADPKLNGKYTVEPFELVLSLALTCTGLKQQRPSMEQVVSKLEKALDISTRMKSVKPQFTLSMD